MLATTRSIKVWLIFILGMAVIIGCIAGCRALNRSGVCFKRWGWVSDEEKMAFAITAKMGERALMAERVKIARAYMFDHPNCCRMFSQEKLIGQWDEIATGEVARPTYIRINPDYTFVVDGREYPGPGNVIISSCADEWWPWDNVPLPPDAKVVP
jgi:hypothetical protein